MALYADRTSGTIASDYYTRSSSNRYRIRKQDKKNKKTRGLVAKGIADRTAQRRKNITKSKKPTNTAARPPIQYTAGNAARQYAAMKANDIPNTPYNPTGGPTGGGGSYGSSGSATATGAPKYPTIPGNNAYDDILKQMSALYGKYGDLGFEYNPMYFDYGDWKPDEQAYLDEANKRMGYETAARMPVWNEQEDANIRAYQAALDQATREQQLQQAAIASEANTEAGRLSNMMANTGMGAGQGALQEKFGIDQAFANQQNAVASQYGMQRAQAALEKANALGGIAAERASYFGGLPGQVYDIANQAEAEAYNKWQQERGFQYQNYSDAEARRYQAYTDQYTSMVNQLNNQLGVLGQMAGLTQDQRDFMATQLINKYNAEWNAFVENRNFNFDATQAGIAQGNWIAEYNKMLEDAERNWNLGRADLRLNAGLANVPWSEFQKNYGL